MKQALYDIVAERIRQVDAEGWTAEHDDAHKDMSLSRAAACYALNASGALQEVRKVWPDSWDDGWFKPRDTRRDLIRAAALILAEIERMDRCSARTESDE